MHIGQWAPSSGHTFIIAEAGVNHNGSLDMAKLLIEAAKGAGADAVKFQTWKTEALVTRSAGTAEYQRNATGADTQYDMLRSLELSYDNFRELKRFADERGILFLSTPDEEQSLEFLVSLGVPALKVGSGEITNTPFLRRVAAMNLPTILSTGMSTLGDVERALGCFPKLGELVVLHCTSEYPAPLESLNLRAMLTLKRAFGVEVGFSDHSEGYLASALAVGLGAVAIEKHLTLDRNLPGPDHQASLNPDQFRELVTAVRSAEQMLGTGRKLPSERELANRQVVTKNLVFRRAMRAGDLIGAEDICLKRASGGLPPDYLDVLLGRALVVNVEADEVVTWRHVAL